MTGRCRHVHAVPSRFVKHWFWCSDCHTFVPADRVQTGPATEHERVAEHIKRDVLHWDV